MSYGYRAWTIAISATAGVLIGQRYDWTGWQTTGYFFLLFIFCLILGWLFSHLRWEKDATRD